MLYGLVLDPVFLYRSDDNSWSLATTRDLRSPLDQSSITSKSANDGFLLLISSVVTRDLVMRSIHHSRFDILHPSIMKMRISLCCHPHLSPRTSATRCS